MEDLGKAYRQKLKELLAQQKLATDSIVDLTKKVQDIEAEIEKLQDDEFVRTGVFSWSEKLTIKITYKDLLEDLIKNTEGKMIAPEEPTNLN